MSTQNENQNETQTVKNTSNRRKGKLIFFGITTIAIMVFIFVQSAMPDVVSAEESNLIVEFIRDIMEKASISVSNQEMLSYLVRKGAHFTEYAVFGISLYALGRTLAGMRKGKKKADSESAQSGGVEEEAIIQKSVQLDDVEKKDAGSKPEQHGGKEKKAFVPDSALIGWVAGTLYAVTDEIHQVFVPGRFGQIRDVIIDSMGVAMGIVILHIIMKTSDRRKAQKNETEIV